MKKTLLLATAIRAHAARLGLCRGHRAEILGQPADRVRPQPVPAGGGEELRGREPRHQGRGDHHPLSGVPAAAADRRAGRQRAGRLDRRPDLGRRLRRGRRHRPARRRGQGRRRHRRHLLPRRLGLGQLRRQALGHPVQRRRLAVLLLQRRPVQGGRRRPGVRRHLRGPEGGRREADRRGKGKFGIGLFAHKGEDTVVVLDIVHLLERRQGARTTTARAG